MSISDYNAIVRHLGGTEDSGAPTVDLSFAAHNDRGSAWAYDRAYPKPHTLTPCRLLAPEARQTRDRRNRKVNLHSCYDRIEDVEAMPPDIERVGIITAQHRGWCMALARAEERPKVPSLVAP